MCTVSFLSKRAESYTTITYLDIKLRINFLKVFFSFLNLMNVSSYHQTDHKHENISSRILFNSQQENRLIHKFCGALSLSIIPHGRCRMQVNGERKVAEIIAADWTGQCMATITYHPLPFPILSPAKNQQIH